MTNQTTKCLSARQLFFVLYASRMVVAITFFQFVLGGRMTTDWLFSLAGAWALTMLACAVSYWCCKKQKNPLNNKGVALLYAGYFLYFAAASIGRFSFFASNRLNPHTTLLLFVVIMAVAACYAAYLGLAALGRFAAFCAAALVLIIAAVLLLNIGNTAWINFFPLRENQPISMLKNSLIFAANSVEPVLYPALADKTGAGRGKALFGAVCSAYAGIIVLVGLCIGVLGAGASLRPYPVFTLFQMTALGGFSRLDVLYTAFWVFAVFLKCAVLLYCAVCCLRCEHRKAVYAALLCAVAVIGFLLSRAYTTSLAEKTSGIYLVAALIYCVVFPVGSLLLQRRKGR